MHEQAETGKLYRIKSKSSKAIDYRCRALSTASSFRLRMHVHVLARVHVYSLQFIISMGNHLLKLAAKPQKIEYVHKIYDILLT